MQHRPLLLLVEDSAIISAVLSETLETAGFDLELAEDGEIAMDLLNDRQKYIRGIVTDIQLGKATTGWDVARRARELIPEVPVVYMSGTHHNEWTLHGVPNSAFVGKPFATAQIVTAITALLNEFDVD